MAQGYQMAPGEKAYVSTSNVIKQVLSLLAQDQLEGAAQLYSHCQEDIGYQIISRAPKERKLMQNLAKMMYAAKDYEKAGMVCEAMGEFKKAAELFERCDNYQQAAELFAKVEDWERAALMYEKYGDYNSAAALYNRTNNLERSAQCFEKAVNHFLAGKFYFQLQKYQKSMELLQKVQQNEDGYMEAAMMIGNILAMKGYLDLAISKYNSVARSIKISPGTVGVFYNLALLLERKRDFAQAKEVFDSIIAVDPSYKDVAARARYAGDQVAHGVQAVTRTEEEEEIIEDLEEVVEERPAAAQAPPARIVSVMDGFEFLKNTSLFETLSLSEMKSFWNICETREFRAGDVIIEQDQPGQALFILKKGAILVQRKENGGFKTLVELSPGAHVGEMSLVDNAPTSARITAKEDGTELFAITREKFEELLSSNDKISIKLYKVFIGTLCERLRKTTAELAEAGKGA